VLGVEYAGEGKMRRKNGRGGWTVATTLLSFSFLAGGAVTMRGR